MRRRILVLAATLVAPLVAPAAFGQQMLGDALGEGIGGGPTCGAFVAQDSVGQAAMLSTIQPLGDEIDPNDADATRSWAKGVADACGDDPDRPLAEAARQALGG